MQMNRRSFLKLGALATAASSFTPSMLANEAKKDLVIYGAPATISATGAVAASRGVLAQKYNTSFITWKNPDELRAGIASGLINITMAPSNLGVVLSNKGQKMRMLNLLTDGLLSVLSYDKEIKKLSDLKGKKIVCSFKNDMPDIVLQSLLKAQKLELDITYTSGAPESMQLLLAGKFDHAVVSEPITSVALMQAKAQGKEIHRAFHLNDEMKSTFDLDYIPLAGMIVRESLWLEQAEMINQLHEDQKAALEFINSNPDEAVEIISKSLPLPKPALAASLKTSKLVVRRAKEHKDDILRFYKILFDLNPQIFGGKLPSDDFFI